LIVVPFFEKQKLFENCNSLLMSALTAIFSKSIGRKLVMAITGLFLVSFLLVHVSGNLQLFYQDGGLAFNKYTKFMTTNPLIGAMEWILFGGFIVHIIWAVMLTAQNNASRPVKYAYKSKNSGASWASRNMFVTGSVLFIFLAVHLTMFWGIYNFGNGTETTMQQAYDEVWKVKQAGGLASLDPDLAGEIVKAKYIDYEAYQEIVKLGDPATMSAMGYSMYELTIESFKQLWIVALYVIAMILLAFHLNHGFQSGFRSLGLVHDKYLPLIKGGGQIVTVVFPLLFASMPLYFYIGSLMGKF